MTITTFDNNDNCYYGIILDKYYLATEVNDTHREKAP